MLELCLLLAIAVVFLPDLVFGGVIAFVWLADKIVVGTAQFILVLLAVLTYCAARIRSVFPHHRRHPAS